jgi:hypothetical protein
MLTLQKKEAAPDAATHWLSLFSAQLDQFALAPSRGAGVSEMRPMLWTFTTKAQAVIQRKRRHFKYLN